MNNREMNPVLKNIYNVIKGNSYTVTPINNDIDNAYANISNADFEGVTKEYFVSTISQISNDMSSLTESTNTIIKKENIINTELKTKIMELEKLIEKNNALKVSLANARAKLAELQSQLASLKIMSEGGK